MWAGVSKGTISKAKRQPMAWKKISSDYISDMGLMCRILKELLQFSNNKIIQLKYGQSIQKDRIDKWSTDA